MDDFDILAMVGNQADRFAELVPDWGAFGFIYGWVFVFSLLTALITFGFVVFKREGGAVSGSLIVQWVAVWAVPLIIQSAIDAFGSGGGEVGPEAFRMLTTMM